MPPESPRPETQRHDDVAPGARRGSRPRRGRRRGAESDQRSFTATQQALERIATAGAVVSVHVVDIDDTTGPRVVLAGDDHVVSPVAGLGVVPLLIDVATAFHSGRLDPAERVRIADVGTAVRGGLWRHLHAESVTLGDLAVLAAGVGDHIATNVLLARVGRESVDERIADLGLDDIAILDGFRDRRGPDDAPHFAVGTTRSFARLFGAIANAADGDVAVSAQVAEWLSLGRDLGLVGTATGLDPFAHEHDVHGLSLLNKTGRADGVHAEAGVLVGPRASVAYAMTVCFDDLSVAHRLRVHDTFRTLGGELMEYVH